MYMRGVCDSCRSAIDKPSPLAAIAGLRFRPCHWVMVDINSDDQDGDASLFLHVPTGRFRRLRLPVLRDHNFVGATDGLFALRDREPPHLASVLNPFTGDILHFAAPLLESCKDGVAYTSVDGGSHSMLAFLSFGMVLCAAPTSHVFTEKNVLEDFVNGFMITMVSFQGNAYCADPFGCVYKFVAPTEQCDDELVVIAQVSPDVDVCTEGHDCRLRSYLVESAGELLLVRYVDRSLKVFSVNIEHKLLEEVKSLGGRALFLAEERCVSVDADKLLSVDEDCIYMLDYEDEGNVSVYNLRGDLEDIISSEDYLHQPFSLVQVLLRYCDYRSNL